MTYQHGHPCLRRGIEHRHQVQFHRQIVRRRQVIQRAQVRHQIFLVLLQRIERVHVVFHGQFPLQTSPSDGGGLLHVNMLGFLIMMKICGRLTCRVRHMLSNGATVSQNVKTSEALFKNICESFISTLNSGIYSPTYCVNFRPPNNTLTINERSPCSTVNNIDL